MPTAARQPDTSSIQGQTLEIVQRLLTELGSHQAAQTVSLHSSLDRDLGLGSLERVELLVRVESKFNIRLPDGIAQQAETPEDWVRAIIGNADGPRSGNSSYQIKQPGRDAPSPPASSKSLVEVLRHHAEVEPDRVHIHLLDEEDGIDITYGQLLGDASKVAAGLVARGLKQNETVAIMLPTCADFFKAFFGVMLAGGIAVPIYPPAQANKIEEYIHRQVAILRNAEVRFLISFDRAKSVSNIIRLNIPSLADVTSVEALSGMGARLPVGSLEPSETGFIQYTSGSTGEPKGVVLSHANILANVRGIGWSVKVRPTDFVVTWLPLYHDMGLIGSWLFSVYYATPITVLSPLSFLRRPERWLWALHNSKGTLCPAPNFSYELCARKITDDSIQGVDLSAWRVAINAGEAVLPDTLERFEKRFKPYGFHAESFVPCYGLAESSVALSFPPIDRRPVIDAIRRQTFEEEGKAVPATPGDRNALRFVANGKPMPEHEIRIVDSEGRDATERAQGRILFRGPSRTAGYFRNPRETQAVIDSDGWMDSGDLGYWAAGELFVTGRVKDCIIKSGRNIIPQEVEAAAADVPGVRRGCVAAFGAVDPETGTERLIVVAETRVSNPPDSREIKAGINEAVSNVLGIPPDKVVLVPPQSIPKTSSGKIRRNETRSLYQSGKLHASKRAPWVQMVSLWLSHFGSWSGVKLARGVASIQKTYHWSSLVVFAYLGGALVRILPGKNAPGRLVRFTSGFWLRLIGKGLKVHGIEAIDRGKAVVFVSNRESLMDPLVLAGSLPAPLLLADGTTLASLPAPARFLLGPRVVPPAREKTAPPGGTPRDRIQKALEAHVSVLVLPDSPIGAPAGDCRFRLDAFHAAAESSSPIVPVYILGTSDLFNSGSSTGGNEEAEIIIGDEIRAEVREPRDLARLRDRVREAIDSLYSCDSV